MSTEINELTAYHSRFASHIGDYLALASLFPSIRLREFEALLGFAGLKSPKIVLEAPAEGKIIEQLLPETEICRADLLEVCGGAQDIQTTSWSLTGIETGRFDAVLSIVPIHHADDRDKRAYIEGARRVLRSGGVLAFGEVERGSRVHEFLDGFVNDHTPSGHVGSYVDVNFVRTLKQAGFEDAACELRSCDWIFDSYDDVYFYVAKLFNLRGLDKARLLDALHRQLGFKEVGGRIFLNWELLYFRGAKP